MVKLSIITINLNNNEGLKKTILSVVEQTFSDFEFIIIDGNSTDGSAETIKQFSNKITNWISEKDTGIYNAMNKGIKQAKGEYCLFLNSGDWLASTTILTEFFASKPNTDIVAGDIYFFDTIKNEIKWHISSPDELTAKTLFNGTLPHQATFIKRTLFEKFGFYNEALKIASDWLFFVETLLEHRCSYQHFNKVVAYFNMDGISCKESTFSLPRKEQLAVLQEKYPLFIKDFEQLARLEQETKAWKESREFKSFQLLQKLGIIQVGILFIRFQNFIIRKISPKHE